MMSLYSDKKIIRDIKSPDEKVNNRVLTHLYSNYYSMAAAIIKRYGGNTFWVMEIFQEAIISFYESVKKDKFHEKSTIKTFLYAIIKNKWLNAKKDDQTIGLDGNEPLDPTYIDEFYNPYDDPNLIRYLNNWLDELGNPCQKLLINYYYENMSLKDISTAMNYSNENSAKTQKFKCLQRLINLINDKINVKYILNDFI